MKKQMLAMAMMMATATAASAQDLPDRIKTAGKVIIGTTPNYPPVTFRDPQTNELKGYDIAIGNEIGKKLGLEVVWQETSFEQMISALNTGRIDLILGGMNDTVERQELVDFVNYMKTGAQFFVQKTRAGEFAAATDLSGKKIGASRRTNFPGHIAAWSKEHCEAAGLPAMVVTGTEGSADARTQLRQGRIDAAVQGNESLPYIMSLDPEDFSLVGEPYAFAYQGIGVAKPDAALRDAIAAALQTMLSDGSYQAIVAEYGVQPSAIEAVAVNSQVLQ